MIILKGEKDKKIIIIIIIISMLIGITGCFVLKVTKVNEYYYSSDSAYKDNNDSKVNIHYLLNIYSKIRIAIDLFKKFDDSGSFSSEKLRNEIEIVRKYKMKDLKIMKESTIMRKWIHI